MGTADHFQIINQATDYYALALVMFVLAFALVIFLNRRRIKHRWRELKIRYRLNRLGHDQIVKIHCPDGLGYHFTIDRLILRHDGITLLLYKKYPGKIFCAENIDYWTQMLGQRSYRFANPLYDLECQIKAVSACVPDIAVDGFLFFDQQSTFPKGHPERVIELEKIPQELKKNKQHKMQAPVMAAWKELKAMPQG